MKIPSPRVALPSAAALLLVIVIFQNLNPITVDLLFWNVTMSKAALIGLSAFLGLLAGLPMGLKIFRKG
ncbi:hypothetical protein [Engelhardtia mirabilis]|uniref:Lipopolysaccharide assembly protein A domain-containing protein n=1 Tax=Engelhardtia mirabilis TaxID=2528011 RepID=A0A518BKZ3_9BACT|nr:hypothetical protein Pla133_27260 [Planctomycetes bacterium Pla133]QDV01964.1 hypothetical protein Pla86_27250 [Planctomycetes bacterium Pla86]